MLLHIGDYRGRWNIGHIAVVSFVDVARVPRHVSHLVSTYFGISCCSVFCRNVHDGQLYRSLHVKRSKLCKISYNRFSYSGSEEKSRFGYSNILHNQGFRFPLLPTYTQMQTKNPPSLDLWQQEYSTHWQYEVTP